MDKCLPSLPFLERSNHDGLQLTESDWAFLNKNKNLFRKAASHALGHQRVRNLSTLDILLTVAPAVAKALRDWTVDGGAKVETFAFNYARNFLKPGLVNMYPCVGKPVRGGRKYPPICAGSCELQEITENEKHSTVGDEAFATVLGCFKKLSLREQDILTHCFGLYGTHLTTEKIALRHGVSKARVGQIIDAALLELRSLYGYTGTRPIGPRPPQPWRPRKTSVWQRMRVNKCKKNSYWRKRQNEKVDS
jgi:hypothetical protein